MRNMSLQVHEEHGLEDEPEDGVGQGGQGLPQVQTLASVMHRCNIVCNVWHYGAKRCLLSENSVRAANNTIT